MSDMKYTSKSIPAKRLTPKGGEYFFGYYDLQPYNSDETLHLTHKTSFADRLQVRGDVAQIGVIDLKSEKFIEIETTHAWNFQQGAMLQWNPKAADREIIYNDIVDGQHVGVVLDIHFGKKRFLDRPVANVSRDGRFALSINMSRLYDFRPGYGYATPTDPFYYKNHSDSDGVFLIDMETGKSKLILSYEEIWNFSNAHAHFGKDEKMVINHITFNPSGDRFLCLARNFPPKGQWHDTAIITANRDGSDLFLLSDYGVQSHYYWLNDKDVVFFSDGKELECTVGIGNNYILTDKTYEGKLIADGFWITDNHMIVSPDGKLMLTHSYPEWGNMQELWVYNFEKNHCVHLGNYYSIFRECTDIRCDLHARWNRRGNKISFDSTHEGFRGVYEVELPEKTVREIFGE